MSDDNSSPHLTKRLEPPSGAAIETFSDLLADAQDLEEICTTALQFALETLGRNAGILASQTLQEQRPACIAHCNLPEQWTLQLDNPDSLLRRTIQNVLQSGQYVIGNLVARPQVVKDLAAAIPIPARSGIQGVLLVQGPPCSPVEVDWLLKLSRPMGRAIRMRRRLEARLRYSKSSDPQPVQPLVGISNELEELQIELLRGVRSLLDAEQSVLALVDSDGEEWITRKALDEQSNWMYQNDPLTGGGLLRECLQTQQALLVRSVDNDARFDPGLDSLPGVQANSVIFAPLIRNGRAFGAIEAINKRRVAFEANDLAALTAFAGIAAQAIFELRRQQEALLADVDCAAEEWELANTRVTLNAVLENLPGYLYIIDRGYELTSLSASTARRSGQEAKTLQGKICYQAFYQRSEPCLDCMVAETFDNNKRTLRTTTRQLAKNPDAIASWEIRSYPIFDRSGLVTQAILFEQDITDQREMELVVTQSGKLAALGHLAAGVAHEINNPLTAIIANAQILQRDLPPGDERLESVDLIAMAGARAAQVVRNLLDFARKEQTQRALTNINETLRSSLALVQHELVARSITLEFTPDEQLPLILATPDSLQGVWLNLLLNAIESIDKVPGSIQVASWRSGDEVQVSIGDNGRGIPAERLERIFEPFYTTKAPGRGTGLGLSVCNRIIEQHNGRIAVNSKLGQGSEFIVILPIA
jgi:two-component system, NtrC family, sensor kinase